MKFFTLAFFLLLPAGGHAANSILVTGPRADALVNSLVSLGLDPVGTHEYFQAGVTACTYLADEAGTYFPGGAVGDYMGETCLIYGDADGSDPDGALRPKILIPSDDRELANHPEVRTQLRKLKELREAIEAIVVPIDGFTPVNGKDVLTSRMSGVSGIACDGRNAFGQRQCYVKISSLCPPRQ
jgi:hypothetical protein